MKTTKLLHVSTLALLLTGWSVNPVQAQSVAIFEDVGCCFGFSVDVYEIKCTRASRSLCVEVIDDSSPDGRFIFSLVGTAPAAMIGQGEVGYVDSGSFNSRCLTRPTLKEGTMKGLVSVWADSPGPDPPFNTYTVRATCFSTETGNATPGTVLILKQDE
jgi:hypothetical protein